MSQENVEIAMQATDALNRRDWDAFYGLITPDFEWPSLFKAFACSFTCRQQRTACAGPNCVRVGSQVFGGVVASPVMQQTARVLIADRKTYTD